MTITVIVVKFFHQSKWRKTKKFIVSSLINRIMFTLRLWLNLLSLNLVYGQCHWQQGLSF